MPILPEDCEHENACSILTHQSETPIAWFCPDCETNPPMVTAPKHVLMQELEHLWDDLLDAQRNAIRTDWSMRCDSVRDRILALTRVVGPANPGAVPFDLLLGGFHERVYEGSGIEAPAWDREHVQRTWDTYLAGQAATVARSGR